MAGDWIRLYRDARDHEVFQDDWLWRLFSWCLLSANFRPGSWKGTPIAVGQFVTGRTSGAESLHVTPSKFYRGLQKLVELGCVTLEANSNWTTVTICNWKSYQTSSSPERTANEQPVNSERTADEQQMNTIEEEQEFKKDLNTHAGGAIVAGMIPRSEAFGRFMRTYPRPTAPEATWEVWQAKVYAEAMRQEKPDAEIEEMIVRAAQEFRDSPAGKPPDGSQDYRPAAAKWLQGNCWEEPRELWQQPNGKVTTKSRQPAKPKIRPLEVDQQIGKQLQDLMK